ncbi:Integrator complex subunit 3, partial [Cichlidogyrus casuarinus]
QPVEANGPSLANILGHLDCMRRTCKNIEFLQDREIQAVLRSIAQSSVISDKIKANFAELLALVEDGEISNKTSHTSKRSSETLLDGKKGGHSLRKLDSRRAAEAEKRLHPSPNKSISSKLETKPNPSSSSSSSSDQSDNDEDFTPNHSLPR